MIQLHWVSAVHSVSCRVSVTDWEIHSVSEHFAFGRSFDPPVTNCLTARRPSTGSFWGIDQKKTIDISKYVVTLFDYITLFCVGFLFVCLFYSFVRLVYSFQCKISLFIMFLCLVLIILSISLVFCGWYLDRSCNTNTTLCKGSWLTLRESSKTQSLPTLVVLTHLTKFDKDRWWF